jgi:hypothetical protein
VCGVCIENYEIGDYLSLPRLQAIYKGVGEPVTQAAQQRPWKPQAPGMLHDPYSQFNNYPQWNQWQNMNKQPFANQPWQQNWRGSSYSPMSQKSYPMSYAHHPTLTPYQIPYLIQPQMPPA